MWPFGRKKVIVRRYGQGWLGRRKFEKDANNLAKKGYHVVTETTTGNFWSGANRNVTFELREDERK